MYVLKGSSVIDIPLCLQVHSDIFLNDMFADYGLMLHVDPRVYECACLLSGLICFLSCSRIYVLQFIASTFLFLLTSVVWVLFSVQRIKIIVAIGYSSVLAVSDSFTLP